MEYRDAILRKLLIIGSLAALGTGVRPLAAQHTLRFEAEKELRTGVVFGGGYFLPRWSGPGLLGVESSSNDTAQPVIYVINRGGQREDVGFQIADAAIITVLGVAGGADGALALVGKAVSRDSRAGWFVAWISPDRKQQTVTRLNPYLPDAVGIAADGVVWTAGQVVVDGTIPEHQILRRFDRSGKLLGSFVENTTVKGHSTPSAGSYLLTSRDRVGWYFPRGNGYIEFSLDGTLLGRYFGAVTNPKTQQVRGAALSEDNELVVSRRDRQINKSEALTLDRSTRTWTPVQMDGWQGPQFGWEVLGFDGDNLLTSRNYRALNYHKRQKATGISQ